MVAKKQGQNSMKDAKTKQKQKRDSYFSESDGYSSEIDKKEKNNR